MLNQTAQPSPLVSGSAEYTQAAPAAAMHAYSRKVPGLLWVRIIKILGWSIYLQATQPSPLVSGSAEYTQTAPAAAMHAYSKKVPEPPSVAVATGKVWLTAALASQLEAVAAPLARPRSCTGSRNRIDYCHVQRHL